MDFMIRFKTKYIESNVYFIIRGRNALFYSVKSIALLPKPEPDFKLAAVRTIPEIFWQ